MGVTPQWPLAPVQFKNEMELFRVVYILPKHNNFFEMREANYL